ncbi:MAG: histidine kinase [Acidimicrobiales bacterium]
MGEGTRLEARRRDGSTFLVEISLSPVEGPEGPCTVAAVRDVTSRVAIETEVHAARERSQLIDDRERMARELHDNVIQSVFTIGIGLQSLASKLSDDDVKHAALGYVDDLDGVITRIRSAIFDVAGDRIELEDD